jgi:hypothetical protein
MIPSVKKFSHYLATLPKNVFSANEIGNQISDFARAINDPLDGDPEIYVQWMADKGLITTIDIQGQNQIITRYHLPGEVTVFEIAASLQNNSYISHLAAAWHHGLVTEQPAIICISAEGTNRMSKNAELEQENIDQAFQKPQRKSGATLHWRNSTFLLLTALNAREEGIEQKRYYQISNLERTLIDMVVRPAYSGGPETILKAFKKAISTFSITALLSLLEKLNYVYPYHQSIGFYLTMARYDNLVALDTLKKPGMPFTFYLDYEIKDPVYSDEWNLYFPAALLT